MHETPLLGTVRRADPDTAVRFVGLGEIDYVQAWDRQRELADARADGRAPDTVLLLTHPAVYTAGRRTQPEDRPVDGTPVVDVDRGGRITWHGPGQLVGYPIVKLPEPLDVVAWVRLLEQALIGACAELGLNDCGRVPGRSGVWLPATGGRPERKVAAIGVRVARGVTMHGFAVNCDADLAAFDRIVPCGIRDAGVTSLTKELGRRVGVADAEPIVRAWLARALDGECEIDDHPVARTDHPTTGSPALTWHLDPALSRSS